MKRSSLFTGIVCLLILSACKKDPETFVTASISDYAPLTVGKYITYRLDTFKYLPFSIRDTTVSYEVKHVVEGLINDNLGRPAYKIFRYIRKSPQQAWQPDNSFMVINTESSLEYIENNMRFLKLKLPIIDGYTWKGNSFIDTYSFNSDVKYLDDWDYVYDSLHLSRTIGTFNLDSTIRVDQRDEVIGNPADPNSYSEQNFGAEIYAKGIGLVYRRFLHTEFQPATPGNPSSYDDRSYGIILTMIDHN
ncbi:MAG: hypothetical protein ABIN67_07695 [Ferruginibacter sp.]